MAKFETIPNEVFLNIASHLTFGDIKNISLLSRSMHQLAVERLCRYIFIPYTADLRDRRQYFKLSHGSINDIEAAQNMFRAVGHMVPLMTQLRSLKIFAPNLSRVLESSSRYKLKLQLNDFIPTSLSCVNLSLRLDTLNTTQFDRSLVDLLKTAFPKLTDLILSRFQIHESEDYVLLDITQPSQIRQITLMSLKCIETRLTSNAARKFRRIGDGMVEVDANSP